MQRGPGRCAGCRAADLVAAAARGRRAGQRRRIGGGPGGWRVWQVTPNGIAHLASGGPVRPRQRRRFPNPRAGTGRRHLRGRRLARHLPRRARQARPARRHQRTALAAAAWPGPAALPLPSPSARTARSTPTTSHTPSSTPTSNCGRLATATPTCSDRRTPATRTGRSPRTAARPLPRAPSRGWRGCSTPAIATPRSAIIRRLMTDRPHDRNAAPPDSSAHRCLTLHSGATTS